MLCDRPSNKRIYAQRGDEEEKKSPDSQVPRKDRDKERKKRDPDDSTNNKNRNVHGRTGHWREHRQA
jgi:hypothetical protein